MHRKLQRQIAKALAEACLGLPGVMEFRFTAEDRLPLMRRYGEVRHSDRDRDRREAEFRDRDHVRIRGEWLT